MTTTTTTTVVITFAPITFAPPANRVARAAAERAAIAEVSRAITVAYYAGVLGGTAAS